MWERSQRQTVARPYSISDHDTYFRRCSSTHGLILQSEEATSCIIISPIMYIMKFPTCEGSDTVYTNIFVDKTFSFHCQKPNRQIKQFLISLNTTDEHAV